MWYNTPKVDIKDLNIAPFLLFYHWEQNKTLEDVGVYNGVSLTVTGTGEPEHVGGLGCDGRNVAAASSEAGVGRLFSRRTISAGSPETVLLEYGYWQKKFGGARSVIGQ